MRSLSRCIDLALSATIVQFHASAKRDYTRQRTRSPSQIEIRPAEDDAFLKFQAVHLRFDLPLAPLRRKRGFNRCIIETNPVRHFFEWRQGRCVQLV
jgi:hypothetical protein